MSTIALATVEAAGGKEISYMYYVYLLQLKNEGIYTGSTPNLEERMAEHKNGYCKSTRNLRPVKLLWHCCFNSRLAARKFENYLERGSGQAFRNRHLISV